MLSHPRGSLALFDSVSCLQLLSAFTKICFFVLIDSHFGSLCSQKILSCLKLAIYLNQGQTNTFLSPTNDKISSMCFILNDERSEYITGSYKTCQYPCQGKAFLFHSWALIMNEYVF